jgi:hypothetical protein
MYSPKGALVALVGMASLATSGFAAGFISGPCGAGAFGGPLAPVLVCDLGDGATATQGGSADAGLNYFANFTSPVALVGTMPGITKTIVVELTSDPTWTTDPVLTFLRLDGTVTIEAGFVDILFEGFLGGVKTNEVKFYADKAGVYTLGIPDINPAAPALTPATSILTITVHSIASYEALASPTFIGAVPEPGTFGTIAAGAAALLVAARRRRR